MASRRKLKKLVAYWEGVEKKARRRLRRAKRKQRKYRKQLRRPKHISKRGLNMIAGFEGFRSEPYKVHSGEQYLTIGYGHYGPDVKPGMKITREEGLSLLRRDVAQFERGVKDAVKVRLNQNEFDALVSFAFNVGLGALRSSTLLAKLNSGRRRAAADQFMRWVYSGGQVFEGLRRRRSAERALFLK